MQIFRREFVQKHELTWGHGQHRWIEQRLAYRIGKCGKIVPFFFVGVENQPTFGPQRYPKSAASQVVHKQVTNYLSDQNLLSDDQHGFRRQHYYYNAD